ncbi:MAG: uridylate kinase [Planctomycetes bacterium]|nr:uridylate kinase [Planctomycetota bacterium]
MQASSVIKLGGSLLGLPDLPARLKGFLADFARPCPVLLCGGGDLVERIRAWDRAFDLGEEASHWIAVRALTINALVLERAVPILEHAETSRRFPSIWRRGKVPLYDAYRFVRDVDEARADPLPRRWRVTSDSIAARMAACLGAGEVVLLKSVTVPEGTTVEEAARQGIVDPHFPTAARDVARVAVVNLRDEEPKEAVLLGPFDRRQP